MKFDKKALTEALQEVGRVALFAAVSAVVAYLLKQLAGMDQTDMVVVVGTLALKLVDRYIHENKSMKSNGLTDTKMFLRR